MIVQWIDKVVEGLAKVVMFIVLSPALLAVAVLGGIMHALGFVASIGDKKQKK